MKLIPKNKILVISFLLGLILCYWLAFSETLALRKEYKELKAQQLISQNLPIQLSSLKQKNKHFDQLLNTYQISETSWQNTLLERIDRYAQLNALKILKVDAPHTITSNDLKISSYKLQLSGTFNDLLGLIYELESLNNLGQFSNVHFTKITEYRTKDTHLEVEFMIQVFN